MGFSDMKYFANESSHGIDISIELYRPTKTEELNFTVNFVVQVITGTAGKNYLCYCHVIFPIKCPLNVQKLSLDVFYISIASVIVG